MSPCGNFTGICCSRPSRLEKAAACQAPAPGGREALVDRGLPEAPVKSSIASRLPGRCVNPMLASGLRLIRIESMNDTTERPTVTLRIPGDWGHPGELLERMPDGFRLTPDHLILQDGTKLDFVPMQP